jgi:acetyltransferase-like isoleucine patch superfamily enzyme
VRAVKMEKGPGLHRKIFDKKKSIFRKYREMYLGDLSLAGIIYYELVILLFTQIPGSLGFFLRKKFFAALFKRAGKGVIFGKNLTIRHPQKISFGSNVIIDDNCLIDAKGETNEGISIGDNVTIGRNSSLVCKNGNIKIGSSVNITTNVNMICGEDGEIRLGNNIDIGSFSHLSGGTYNYSKADMLPSAQGRISKGVVLEDLVWVGAGVVIIDGVTIGEKSMIGAGAVVTKDVPPNSVAVGVPAKVVRERR